MTDTGLAEVERPGARSPQARAGACAPLHFRRDAAPDPHQLRRRAVVLAMLREVPGTLLDYGCGYGDLTWAMAVGRPRAVGVDVDAGRIDFARAHYAPLQFAHCREHGLDFPDASFDVVTSVVVTPFVPDVDGYLREARRVLTPGGHLLLATRAPQWLRRTAWRLRGRGPRMPMPGSERLHQHDARQAAALLDRHGFTIVRRGALYDPPFSDRRNLVDVAGGAIELMASCLHWHGASQYPVFLARKR
ncbi:MAG TPA: class I SAM-dependent methyltransferase [Rhodanobacteraceae bacterium]|nr:class I SAM-dependent methyltransferase [Rhodanobacteraceae bacterium]